MSWFSKLLGETEKPQAQFVRTQRQPDGNTFDIYTAPNRQAALAFLREHEVKEERRYAIVETPDGNLGKDLVLIFDEKSEETIELGKRKPLPKPQPSAGRCCTCGYMVIPFGRRPDFGGSVSARAVMIMSEAKEKGGGCVCSSCGAISCACCATPQDSPVCGVCGAEMSSYHE